MLSQNDLERERYQARIKMQRDELSRLDSAREDGLEEGETRGLQKGLHKGRWLGVIGAYQDLLGRPLTPEKDLLALPEEQLQALAQQLKQELGR